MFLCRLLGWIGLSAAVSAMGATLPRTVVLGLGPGVTMSFVLIEAGSFVMGSDPNFSDGDETPAHRVTLTQPFYLGECEVTQEQWVAVMGANPSKFRGARNPVENVSWTDCQRFLTKLSRQAGRDVRLPTEAQWEYACRAGTTTRWYFGDDEAALPRYAWCGSNAKGTTHSVATRPANPWGLHDLYGNVWEWCADWYARHYFPDDAIDPTGPATGDARVLRGGAWGDSAEQIRSGYRNSMGPGEHNAGAGFRCVLIINPGARAK